MSIYTVITISVLSLNFGFLMGCVFVVKCGEWRDMEADNG